MKQPVEIYFTGGQNTQTEQELLLTAGELKSLKNADFYRNGVLTPGKSFVQKYLFPLEVHSLVGTPDGKVYVGEGTMFKEHNSSTSIISTLSGNKVRAVDNNGWLYIADGTYKKKFRMDDPAEIWDWGVDNPTEAPVVVEMGGATDPAAGPTVGADAAAGNPNGTYDCYYTYVIQYEGGAPGTDWETNLSPAASATVSNKKIAWSDIAVSSDPLVTHKRLWRKVGGIIKYVAIIENDVTTYLDNSSDALLEGSLTYAYVDPTDTTDGTYSCYYSWVAKYEDDSEYETNLAPVCEVEVSSKKRYWVNIPASTNPEITHKRLYVDVSGLTKFLVELPNATLSYVDPQADSTLLGHATFDRTGYYIPPDNIWEVIEHYSRIFVLVNGTYSNCLFWSEPYEPQAFIYDALTADYSNYTNVFRRRDRCTGIAEFGGDLFIASKSTFKRLVGSNPSYWALRPTMTKKGNVAKYAMRTVPMGIIHVWYDGIYLFNGFNSARITAKNDPFFESVNWNNPNEIESVYDGQYYRLFIQGRTFVIDLSNYPKIRSFEEDTQETLAWYNSYLNKCWYAKGSAIGEKTGNGAVAFEAWSKTFPLAGIVQVDSVSQLNYEIDTAGQDVTLTLYFDGVEHDQTITLNTSSRVRASQSIPIKNARTVSIKLSGNLNNKVKIYEPWILGAEAARG